MQPQPYGFGANRQPAVSAAVKSAETLFETKNVAEIREIEGHTRKDIESKNVQLRQLVGDSYRDLIDSADKIMAISQQCSNILGNVKGMQDAFVGLASKASSANGTTASKTEAGRRHEELYAVGSRVKYLVDTPEVIWGCLDSKQHLEAARRFQRAREVHSLLQASFPPEALARFPLLRHQWPLVVKFEQQILDTITATLACEGPLSSDQATDALAALAALQQLDSAAALQQLLEARHGAIAIQLQAAAGAASQTSSSDAAVLLCRLVGTFQDAVAQAGDLFLPDGPSSALAAQAAAAAAGRRSSSASSGSSSMLQARVQEDDLDASELFFGGAFGIADGPECPEAVAWRKRSAALSKQLAPLPKAEVEAVCSQWLRHVGELFSAHGPALLQACSDVASVHAAEEAVCSAIAAWRLGTPPTSSSQSGAATAPGTTEAAAGAHVDGHLQRAASALAGTSPLSRAGSLAASAQLQRSSSAAVGGGSKGSHMRDASTWEAVSEAVLGRPLEPWQELLQAPFTRRAQQLISAAFGEAARCLQGPLQEALQEAASSDAEPAGAIRSRTWPTVYAGNSGSSVIGDGVSAGQSGAAAEGSHGHANGQSQQRVARLQSVLSGQLPVDLGVSATGFRQHAHTIRQHFDTALRTALQAALLLMQAPSGAATATTSSTPSLDRSAHARLGGRAGSMQHSSLAGQLGQSAAGSSSMGGVFADRAAELEPFVQQRCLEVALAAAQDFAARLEGLGQEVEGAQGALAVEQALLIGRLCSALVSDSTMLSLILGPPDAWRPALAPPGTANRPQHKGSATQRSTLARARSTAPYSTGGSSSHSSHGASKLPVLTERLSAVAGAAYARWARWAANSLASGLRSALAAEEVLLLTNTPLSWAETVVAADAADAMASLDDDGANGDMRLLLPACVSSSTLALLMAACQETRRAGDHTAATEALQAFAWELHGAALIAVQALLAPGEDGSGADGAASALSGGVNEDGNGAGSWGGMQISDKGVLQLLLDLRVLKDVLAGARPPRDGGLHGVAGSGSGGDGQEAVLAALAQRKQEASALEQELQDRLDPIDWATYEPYLWANAQRYYQRTAVLLGALSQLQRVYPETTGKLLGSGTGSDSRNPLNVLPVAPRFHYLPITAPTSLHGAAKQRHAASMAAQAAGAAGGGLLPAHSLRIGSQLQLQLQQHHQHHGQQQQAMQYADLAGMYSFTDLGTRSLIGNSSGLASSSDNRGADGSAAGGSGSADGASLGAGLSALQAKLQGGGLGVFGTMLGDRAAEAGLSVSAMAQNLGDYLPTSALGTGLLSSFAKGASSMSGRK